MIKKQSLRVAISALIALMLLPAVAAEQQSVVQSAPVTPQVFDGDVRDLPTPRPWQPGDPVVEIPRRLYPQPGFVQPEYETGIDPLLQQQLDYLENRRSFEVFTSPTRNFPGSAYTGSNPPDTVGDVGPAHYIQIVNSGGALVNIWDKTEPTPNLLATFDMDQLASSGICTNGFGDGIVLYDRFAQRWMISEFSNSGNGLCVYISQTPDPVVGGWFAYEFVTPTFPDYPKYGVWPTDANGGQGSYLVTTNETGIIGAYALDRAAMLAGTPATFQRAEIPDLPGFSFQAATPADLDGPDVPPSGAPAVVLRQRDTENHSGPPAAGDVIEMWTFQVDWTTPANTALTSEPNIDVAEFDSDLCGLSAFACFPQPGSGTTLDPLREPIMNRLQYMNYDSRETLVGNFVTDVNGSDHGGLRWFELEKQGGVWGLRQEGTFAPDADHRFMAASAMDQSGNIAIAYNVTSSSTFPSLRYTGRLFDDPLGVMTQSEQTIHPGSAANSSNRYGDYSSMNLDPVDDCTFWFTGMDNTSSNWRTQIASFKFEACGCLLFPNPLTPLASVGGDNQIDLSWDDSELDTVIEYLVLRSRTPGGPYETIAVVPDSSPGLPNGAGYAYQDNDVSGTITYYYVVRASDGGACKSDTSNETDAAATGPCTLPPLFAGLESVSTPYSGICTLDLDWSAGVAECAGPIFYNVYRSTDSSFVPGPANLLVGGVGGTSITDINSLVTGVPYYYVVRAVDDSNAAGETNQNVVSAIPKGALTTGTWIDDAGDTEPAKMIPAAPWSIDPTEGNVGPNVYKTGSYGNNLCSGLTTPELQLGSGSMLSFSSKFEIEPSWDKGEVQISVDNGNSWTRVPLAYPGSSTNTSDSCGLPTGDYFTDTGLTWALYTADLSAWAGEVVRLRFALSTDGSVNRTGWWIDDIAVTQVDVPGACATGSSCPENPFVSVEPAGPLTECLGTSELTATLTGGSGPFSYQWTRDGLAIPGANSPTYTPSDTGTHTYNCEVSADACADNVFDGLGTEITSVLAPSFAGVVSAGDPQTAECSLTIDWNAGNTLCAGPVEYYVYRDSSTPVNITADNIVGPGLAGTSFVDNTALVDHQTYHYLVRARDASTGAFDDNVTEVSALPTGPGTGIFTVFDEDFEDPAVLDAWAVTISPASKTCGKWAHSTSAVERPATGSGGYASADFLGCGNPRIDTTMESPVIDLSMPGLQVATLEYDIYYNFSNGGDSARVEVWDGSVWQVIWADSDADLNQHQLFDVTAFATGNAAFQVRLVYEAADQWFSVDNLTVTVDVLNACDTRVGPPAVPNGAGATTALRGDRLTPNGDTIDVNWDAASCPATNYNLLYGNLADVANYALLGSECAIGTSGGTTWSAVPAGNLYFLVVGTDGSMTEGSWGSHTELGERNSLNASGECGTTTKEISGACP